MGDIISVLINLNNYFVLLNGLYLDFIRVNSAILYISMYLYEQNNAYSFPIILFQTILDIYHASKVKSSVTKFFLSHTKTYQRRLVKYTLMPHQF